MPYGVKMNIKAPHRFMRTGALCWLTLSNPGGGNDRFQISGMSHGGRVVTTWTNARNLTNFRAGWIEDKDYPDWQFRFLFETREQAQAWADLMNNRNLGALV